MQIRASELAAAIGAKLIGEDTIISSISTDTRKITAGSLFVALKGERFDGHKYIEQAFESGAAAAVSQEEKDGKCIILVEDTHKALGDIARWYRSSMNVKVVGITGSVGKTTTKDMVAAVLSQKYNVLKTEGNFNNDIGVPLTLFRLEPENEVAVVEMGMNHFDEISYLTGIAKPDLAIITNVGVSHIENLGSREGILKAKCEIFENMGDKPKIVNGDDDMLITVKDKFSNVRLFSAKDSSAEVYACNIQPKGVEGISCEIIGGGIDIEVNIPVPGIHMVSNALAAASAALELGLNAEQIKKGIEGFKPTAMRMSVDKADCFVVLNDVYNANPVSTKAGIEVLSYAEGKTCCILGDMLELGSFSKKLHAEVGEYAVNKNIDAVVCIGAESKAMYEAAHKLRDNNVYYFADKESFMAEAENILSRGMTVLVKASRGMHFEAIVDYLKQIKSI